MQIKNRFWENAGCMASRLLIIYFYPLFDLDDWNEEKGAVRTLRGILV